MVTEAPTAPALVADAHDEFYLMDHPDSTEEIPILDISPALSGAPGALEAVASQLRQITETIGFFYLKGHGVSPDLVDRVFAQSRLLHGLPADEKAKIAHRFTDSFQSGYVAPATPRSASTNVDIIAKAKPNLLAKFLVTLERAQDHPDYKPMNVWPESLPDFKDIVSEYHAAILKLGRSFLPIWATSLGMPKNYFDAFFGHPHLTLSLLHYPPQKKAPGDRQYGLAPHHDNSFMTFLAQSNVPGLAVRMPSGHWKLVENIPGTFLVNTGNVITRWTNELYLSTKHRVINTADVDRYSIPVFFGPSGDALIECIPTCNSDDNPARHAPITYRQLREWYYGLRDG